MTKSNSRMAAAGSARAADGSDYVTQGLGSDVLAVYLYDHIAGWQPRQLGRRSIKETDDHRRAMILCYRSKEQG